VYDDTVQLFFPIAHEASHFLSFVVPVVHIIFPFPLFENIGIFYALINLFLFFPQPLFNLFLFQKQQTVVKKHQNVNKALIKEQEMKE
jgi:predicted RND superfamily exporter protein